MGFSEFIRERQFLSNVSPSTLEWYKYSFRWLQTESPSQDELKAAVLRMRKKGLKATGCNSAIRAINTYVHWVNAGPDVKCSPACKHPKIAQLKEPQLVLPTFTEQQIRLLVTWKPKNGCQRRLHLLVLFLLDTGCRISEALNLRMSEIDFENLLVTLDGKGRKGEDVDVTVGPMWKPTARRITLQGEAMALFARLCSPDWTGQSLSALVTDLSAGWGKRRWRRGPLFHMRHSIW
jgi:integrase